MFQCKLTGKDGSGFGSWKTVPVVPVPRSVSGKRFRRFRFPVPVRFLSHPVLHQSLDIWGLPNVFKG